MKLDQTQILISEIETYIGSYARRKQWSLEVYQPLIDELSRLRISYSRYRYDQNSFILQDITEESLARELLLDALSTIYSLLILPVLMIDRISQSKAMRLPTKSQVADDAEYVGQDDTLIKVLTDINQDSERLSGDLLDLFRSLVNETNEYVRQVDGRASAEDTMGLIREYFGEI